MDLMFNIINTSSEKAHYFMERTKVIQSNIANADTPLYKPRELLFIKELENQEETIPLKKEDPRHMDIIEPPFKTVVNGYLYGYDGNKVDVEHELAKLAESSVMYQTLVEIMKKEAAKLKYAISGR